MSGEAEKTPGGGGGTLPHVSVLIAPRVFGPTNPKPVVSGEPVEGSKYFAFCGAAACQPFTAARVAVPKNPVGATVRNPVLCKNVCNFVTWPPVAASVEPTVRLVERSVHTVAEVPP